MDFQETLRHIRHEYHSIIAATCQDEQASNLLDPEKVARFPTFYYFLLRKGYSRQELSAHGIGRDVEA